MNTDQRSKYTGAVWMITLTKADIKISMDGQPANWITLSSKGCGGHLSRKLLICMKFLQVLRKMGKKTIELHSSERPNIALDKRTPDSTLWPCRDTKSGMIVYQVQLSQSAKLS